MSHKSVYLVVHNITSEECEYIQQECRSLTLNMKSKKILKMRKFWFCSYPCHNAVIDFFFLHCKNETVLLY